MLVFTSSAGTLRRAGTCEVIASRGARAVAFRSMQPMTATFQRCSRDIENFDVVRLENGEMAICLRPGQSPDRLPGWKPDVP